MPDCGGGMCGCVDATPWPWRMPDCCGGMCDCVGATPWRAPLTGILNGIPSMDGGRERFGRVSERGIR